VDHLNRAKAGKRYSISASRAAVFRDPKPSNGMGDKDWFAMAEYTLHR